MGSLTSPAPSLAVAASTNYQTQSQSPLFGLLPGEIRNAIFSLALAELEDQSEAYPEDSYWYRPGYSAPHKSNSSLLRTCKLSYIEGHRVFLQELELAFWFDRGPSGRTCSQACKELFRRLTPTQADNLGRVRFFTQMHWLDNGWMLQHHIFNEPQFRPSSLTITIRYSDWRWWECNASLTMSEAWLSGFKGPGSLRELRVEYETWDWKKDQVMKIVQRNKTWKLAIENDDQGHLSAENTKLLETMWTGTSKRGGHRRHQHGKGDTVTYVVVTDTWRYVEEPIGDSRARRNGHVYEPEPDQWSSADEDQSEEEEEEYSE